MVVPAAAGRSGVELWRLDAQDPDDVSREPDSVLASIFSPKSPSLVLPTVSGPAGRPTAPAPSDDEEGTGGDAGPAGAGDPKARELGVLECVSIGVGAQDAAAAAPPAAAARPAKQARRTAGGRGTAAGGSTTTRQEQQGACLDAVGYAGGLVWCADFCPGMPEPPEAGGPAPAGDNDDEEWEAEWVAVGVHARGHARNIVGTPLQAPGALQIWALPRGSAAVGAVVAAAVPRCELCIAHDGAVVWDAKWCPTASSLLARAAAATAANGQQRSSLPLLGVLAMVVGDGSVQVCAVPDPRALPQRLQSPAGDAGPSLGHGQDVATALTPLQQHHQERDATGRQGMDIDTDAAVPGTAAVGGQTAAACPAPPPLLRIRPAVHLTREQMGGSLPRCCIWQPSAAGPGPGSSSGGGSSQRLLVGCWDGTVAGWSVPLDRLGRVQVRRQLGPAAGSDDENARPGVDS